MSTETKPALLDAQAQIDLARATVKRLGAPTIVQVAHEMAAEDLRFMGAGLEAVLMQRAEALLFVPGFEAAHRALVACAQKIGRAAAAVQAGADDDGEDDAPVSAAPAPVKAQPAMPKPTAAPAARRTQDEAVWALMDAGLSDDAVMAEAALPISVVAQLRLIWRARRKPQQAAAARAGS
jgi:hypothetical protein